MSHYDHENYGYTCPECGGFDGYHDYNKHEGNGSLGGSLTGKIIFFFACIFGVAVMIICPPLGAAIIAIAAKETGV